MTTSAAAAATTDTETAVEGNDRLRRYHVSVNVSMIPDEVRYIDANRQTGLSRSEWIRQAIRMSYPDFPE
jgi:hypothetical protein